MGVTSLIKLGKNVGKAKKTSISTLRPKPKGKSVKAGRTEKVVFGTHSSTSKPKAASKSKPSTSSSTSKPKLKVTREAALITGGETSRNRKKLKRKKR